MGFNNVFIVIINIFNKINLKYFNVKRGTPLNLVYLLYDEYLKRGNCNYIFYLAIGLILTQEEVIHIILLKPD